MILGSEGFCGLGSRVLGPVVAAATIANSTTTTGTSTRSALPLEQERSLEEEQIQQQQQQQQQQQPPRSNTHDRETDTVDDINFQHYLKDPKLWELWYDPYYGSCIHPVGSSCIRQTLEGTRIRTLSKWHRRRSNAKPLSGNDCCYVRPFKF